jgi:peptidoglycan/xylan/chitin deacetylase (PgdA/CDA1 family)
VQQRGQVMVTWTRRALDGIPTTTDRIVHRLAPAAQAGDILALHDGVEPHIRRNQQPTVAAIRPLVQGLRDRGLQLVRLDELLGRPGYLTNKIPASESQRGSS